MALYGGTRYRLGWYGTGDDYSTLPLRYSVRVDQASKAVSSTSLPPMHSANQFDDFGALVGVNRLKLEPNWQYRRRIRDAMVNIANSAYRGLVNGITRDLGLSLYTAITINPKLGPSGFMAPDPYIWFDGVWLYLYSDYANGVLDWAIDRYQPGGNFEVLQNLVDVVNQTSFFEASLWPGVDPYTRSMVILNQSNRGEVRWELVPSSTKFRLRHSRVIPGTVFFTNRVTFRNEMEVAEDVTEKGDYHIDYNRGEVTVFTVPSVQEIVRYQYTIYPFNAVASPIILNNISNDNFRIKMFEQIICGHNEYTHGLPTELGVDIINELVSVYPAYWGT